MHALFSGKTVIHSLRERLLLRRNLCSNVKDGYLRLSNYANCLSCVYILYQSFGDVIKEYIYRLGAFF